MHMISVNLSNFTFVFVVDGRVVDAVHERPVAVAVAGRSATRRNRRCLWYIFLIPGLVGPGLNSARFNPSSLAAGQGQCDE
eukprot:455466-Pyramimonas_sp.AAC.1